MDVIPIALGFLVVTFLGALIKNDAPHWTIGVGRFLIEVASRLQTEEERGLTGVLAEYEHGARQVRDGERAATSLLGFSLRHLLSEVLRSTLRVVARPYIWRVLLLVVLGGVAIPLPMPGWSKLVLSAVLGFTSGYLSPPEPLFVTLAARRAGEKTGI